MGSRGGGDVCVCFTLKKVPEEWQALQVTPAILQASSSKHNAKKNQYNKGERPISSVDHCHPYRRKKDKRNSLLNLHMLQSTCFGT